MPDFTIEISSKSIFGPFTYPTAKALRQDLINGKLDMSQLVIIEDVPGRIAVKEVKPEK